MQHPICVSEWFFTGKIIIDLALMIIPNNCWSVGSSAQQLEGAEIILKTFLTFNMLRVWFLGNSHCQRIALALGYMLIFGFGGLYSFRWGWFSANAFKCVNSISPALDGFVLMHSNILHWASDGIPSLKCPCCRNWAEGCGWAYIGKTIWNGVPRWTWNLDCSSCWTLCCSVSVWTKNLCWQPALHWPLGFKWILGFF